MTLKKAVKLDNPKSLRGNENTVALHYPWDDPPGICVKQLAPVMRASLKTCPV